MISALIASLLCEGSHGFVYTAYPLIWMECRRDQECGDLKRL
jgi:hypothetical protein